MNTFNSSYLSQEQAGSGMKGKGKCGCQGGDGLADLAIKALSHLIPALLAKFGTEAGGVLSKEAIQFARAKGIISNEQDGSGLIAKSRVSKNTGKRFRGEQVQFGVLTKEGVSISQHPTTTQLSEFSTTPGIIPVPKKTARGKKGGASSLPGGASTLPGDGVFLAGVDSIAPKKRGRPVGSGKKKP
jgi:hypothetical protein